MGGRPQPVEEPLRLPEVFEDIEQQHGIVAAEIDRERFRFPPCDERVERGRFDRRRLVGPVDAAALLRQFTGEVPGPTAHIEQPRPFGHRLECRGVRRRVAQPPALPAPLGQDAVALTAWSPNQLTLASTTATPRFLVLSEMYSPGWTAAVDGVPTPIYRTNYLFRGVVVPAGQHTVTFDYRPRSVLVGAAVSGVALIIALAMLVAGRRRR